MTVPSQGRDAPGRSQWPFPRGGRAHCPSRPRVSPVGSDWAEKESGAPARPGQPSTCRHGRAPGSSAAPRPLLFVTARLPVCGHRPGLTSRAGKPPKAASFSETLPLGPASCLLRIRRPPPGNPRRAVAAARGSLQRAARRDGRAATGHQRALRGRPGCGPAGGTKLGTSAGILNHFAPLLSRGSWFCTAKLRE